MVNTDIGLLAVNICDNKFGNCSCKPHGSPCDIYQQFPDTNCHKAIDLAEEEMCGIEFYEEYRCHIEFIADGKLLNWEQLPQKTKEYYIKEAKEAGWLKQRN